MATRLYLTKNRAPAGAPTTSRFTGDSGGLFVGNYVYPNQSVEGIATRIGTSIPSYTLTASTGTAGSRKMISVSSGTNVIQKIAGEAIGTYAYHKQQMAAAVFSIRLSGASSLSGNEMAYGNVTENIALLSWGGHVSLLNDTYGPGTIGCYPRIIYVYRPSTQSIVGALAEANDVARRWLVTVGWPRTTSDYYAAVACRYTNSAGVSYSTVTGIQDGDLLCAEYWVGRVYINGSQGFDPLNIPGSIDGDLNMITDWDIPIGGTADAANGTTQALGGFRSFFESNETFSVIETPLPRAPQVSVGF